MIDTSWPSDIDEFNGISHASHQLHYYVSGMPCNCYRWTHCSGSATIPNQFTLPSVQVRGFIWDMPMCSQRIVTLMGRSEHPKRGCCKTFLKMKRKLRLRGGHDSRGLPSQRSLEYTDPIEEVFPLPDQKMSPRTAVSDAMLIDRYPPLHPVC